MVVYLDLLHVELPHFLESGRNSRLRPRYKTGLVPTCEFVRAVHGHMVESVHWEALVSPFPS